MKRMAGRMMLVVVAVLLTTGCVVEVPGLGVWVCDLDINTNMWNCIKVEKIALP
jgi:hypothetical protein